MQRAHLTLLPTAPPHAYPTYVSRSPLRCLFPGDVLLLLPLGALSLGCAQIKSRACLYSLQQFLRTYACPTFVTAVSLGLHLPLPPRIYRIFRPHLCAFAPARAYLLFILGSVIEQSKNRVEIGQSLGGGWHGERNACIKQCSLSRAWNGDTTEGH